MKTMSDEIALAVAAYQAENAALRRENARLRRAVRALAGRPKKARAS